MILGMLECLGVELPLGVVGLAVQFSPIVCSGYWAQTGSNPCHWSGRVPGSLDPTAPSWDRCCILLTSDLMILGLLEHLGLELSLGVVRLAVVFTTKVCS